MVEVRCSFCGKEKSAVAKFVAGPGVYICNECVDTCQKIIDSAPSEPSELPFWEAMSDAEMLTYVPKIAAVAGRVEDSLREWVGRLRERGVTWARIGEALGMTRQSAWGRFSGEE